MSGLLAPHENQTLFGHVKTVEKMRDLYDSGRLPTTLIISGPEGIGKTTALYHFMRHTLGKEGNTRHDKQITAGSHPHIKIIEPLYDEKKQKFARDITLDALAGLTDFLRLAPIDNAPRFILITPAETMNRNTQNALLKILEEPPAGVYFFLVTSQPGRLLPTIRSRAVVQGFEALMLVDFSQGLLHFHPDLSDDAVKAQYILTEGALGRALSWMDLEILDTYGDIVRGLIRAHEEGDDYGLMQTVDQVLRTDEDVPGIVMNLLFKRMATSLKQRFDGMVVEPIIPEEIYLLDLWAKIPAEILLQKHDQGRQQWLEAEQRYLDRKHVLLQILLAVLA